MAADLEPPDVAGEDAESVPREAELAWEALQSAERGWKVFQQILVQLEVPIELAGPK